MARERYLLDQEEDTIHQNIIKPVTPKQKRQNWWYYNKVILIVVVFAAFIVGSVIYSVASQVEPDYVIGLITSYTMPEDGIQQLEKCITPYADDRNGDGKVTVNVVNYMFSSNTAEYEQFEASFVKFTADCTINESMIFLHDEQSFDLLKNNFEAFFLYNDGSTMPEGSFDFENAMTPWKDIKVLNDFQPETSENDLWSPEVYRQLYEKLRVSVRAAEGTSIEKDEKDLLYHQDSVKLFQRLKSGEALSEG